MRETDLEREEMLKGVLRGFIHLCYSQSQWKPVLSTYLTDGVDADGVETSVGRGSSRTRKPRTPQLGKDELGYERGSIHNLLVLYPGRFFWDCAQISKHARFHCEKMGGIRWL